MKRLFRGIASVHCASTELRQALDLFRLTGELLFKS